MECEDEDVLSRCSVTILAKYSRYALELRLARKAGPIPRRKARDESKAGPAQRSRPSSKSFKVVAFLPSSHTRPTHPLHHSVTATHPRTLTPLADRSAQTTRSNPFLSSASLNDSAARSLTQKVGGWDWIGSGRSGASWAWSRSGTERRGGADETGSFGPLEAQLCASSARAGQPHEADKESSLCCSTS